MRTACARAGVADVSSCRAMQQMIELSKVLGEMWNDLSDSKKEEWKAKAKNAKPGDGKAKSKSKGTRLLRAVNHSLSDALLRNGDVYVL